MNNCNDEQVLVSILDNKMDDAAMLGYALQQCPDITLLSVWQDVETGLQALLRQWPDIVIMDIQWPDGNGLAYLYALKTACPDVRFLIHTGCADSEVIFESLKAGVAGYVLKGDSQHAVANAIRDLQAGGAPMSPAVAKKVVGFFSREQPAVRGGRVLLTRRETEVLALLAQGRMYKEVAMTLGIEMETTKKHVRNIYGKLEVQNRTEAINKWQQKLYG